MQRNVREARFVLHTLQIAIQAALDVASHIVSDERLGEPETNRELFDRLAQHGWLSVDLTATKTTTRRNGAVAWSGAPCES